MADPVEPLVDQLNAMHIGPPMRWLLQDLYGFYRHNQGFRTGNIRNPARRATHALGQIANYGGVRRLTWPEEQILEFIFNSSDPWTRYSVLARRGMVTRRIIRIVRQHYMSPDPSHNPVWAQTARQNFRNYYGGRNYYILN